MSLEMALVSLLGHLILRSVCSHIWNTVDGHVHKQPRLVSFVYMMETMPDWVDNEL